MENMPGTLFEFIRNHVIFFANDKLQNHLWGNPQSWIMSEEGMEAPCDEWIKDSLRIWKSIRKDLHPSILVRQIDELQEKLKAYLDKLNSIKDKKLYQTHKQILADPEWLRIQQLSLTIYRDARKIFDP